MLLSDSGYRMTTYHIISNVTVLLENILTSMFMLGNNE